MHRRQLLRLVLAGAMMFLATLVGVVSGSPFGQVGPPMANAQGLGGRLLAASWNPDRSVEELVTVDPISGGVSILGDITGLLTLNPGVAALDSTRHRYYLFGQDNTPPFPGLPRLYVSDTQSGQLVASPVIGWTSSNPRFRSLSGLHIEPSTGRVVGNSWNPDRQVEELVSIDATTGVVAVLGDITGLQTLSPGVTALDADRRRYYLPGREGPNPFTGAYRLYTSDTQTGQLVGSPVLSFSSGPGFRNLSGIEVEPSTGRLMGNSWNSTRQVEELVTIDPSSGAVTAIGDVTGLLNLSPGVTAHDAGLRRYYLPGFSSPGLPGGQYRLYVSDTQTGQLAASPIISFPPTPSGTQRFLAGLQVESAQVVDTTPPTCTAVASPSRLWPPNGKPVAVTVAVAPADTGGSGLATQAFTLLSVTSNEAITPADYPGFTPGTPDTTGQLVAVRAGNGPGRVYTLTYQVADGAGNRGTCTATVTVPHDRGAGS